MEIDNKEYSRQYNANLRNEMKEVKKKTLYNRPRRRDTPCTIEELKRVVDLINKEDIR